jgi:peptide/nickel transport system substrate-binding protein
MKRIAFPSRVENSRRRKIAMALSFAVLICGLSAPASVRPKRGGTLRVQIKDRPMVIDPRQWPAASNQAATAERLDSLVFDRLAQLDERGIPRPALAISWEHDAPFHRWQFRLRPGVKFSEGSPLTPMEAAPALQQLLGPAFDVSTNSDSVIIQADRPLPGLLAQLATGRYFIYRAAEDGSLSGTGPFRVAQWASEGSPSKAVLVANESCWAGAPFVDKIELTMGVDPQQQANAISFGNADVVELPASQVRRAAQRGVRTESSDPVDLFALVVDPARPFFQDVRIRRAISLAIDRTSIADVILQHQGTAAGGLLPNWISGYASLFPVSFDLARAKELLAASGSEPSHSSPLVLNFDSGDADAGAVADRVAVNLREGGISVVASGQSWDAKNSKADLRLARYRIASPDSGVALSGLLKLLGEPSTEMETLEQSYAAERAPIDVFHVIPLVHVSESYGLSSQVRDWMPPRWGGWRLQDVWLGLPSKSGGAPQ